MIEKSETSKEKEEKGSGVESQFQPPIQERNLLELAMIRWNFISNYLKDVDSLVKALEGRPRRQVIENRIREQVRRISSPENFAKLLEVDSEPTAKKGEIYSVKIYK